MEVISPGPASDEVPPVTPLPPPRADVAQRAGRGVFWNAVFLPLKMLLGLVASVVVVRLLRIEGYPVLLALTALLSTLGTVSDLGVERALPRYIPEVEMRSGRAGLSRFLRRVVALRGLTLLPFVLLLILVPGPFLAQLHLAPAGGGGDGLPAETGPVLLGMLALMLVLGAISDLSIQVLFAYFRQRLTNMLDVVNAVVMPALRVGFVLAAGTAVSARVLGALLALLLGTLFAVILSVGAMVRALRQEQALAIRTASDAQLARLPPKRTFWRRFGTYSGIMYLLNFSVYLYSQPFAVVVIPLLLADSLQAKLAIAGLGVAYSQVQRLLAALMTPMVGVQTPLFARLHAENRLDGLRTAYTMLSKALILGLVPAGVGMMVLGRNVIILLLLQSGGDAVVTVNTLPPITLALAVLVVGLFGESLISIALTVLLVFERYGPVLASRAAALVSVPLLVLLVPPYGMVGAAVAMAVAGVLARVVALVDGQRALGLRFPWAFLGRVALASGVMGLVVLPLALLMPATPLIGTGRWGLLAFWLIVNGMLVVLGMALFYGVFRLTGGLDAADKERFAALRLPFVGRVLRWL